MLRALRRVTAGWLVAAFVLAAGMPLLDAEHALFDDLRCVDPGRIGNQTARLQTAPDAQADGHCAVCHLQRAVRHAATVAVASVVAMGPDAAAPDAGGPQPQSSVAQHSSSRAPPSL